MIDRIFRKDLIEKTESLEKEVSALEKDNEKLRKRLEKREEKKDADITRFQETSENLKKAKVTIESLRARILELTSEDENKTKTLRGEEFFLPGQDSLRLLDKISSLKSDRDTLLSVYLPAGEENMQSKDAGEEICSHIRGLCSDTGVIGFFDTEKPSFGNFLAVPPFPQEKRHIIHKKSFETEKAADIFSAERHVAFILAHAGESYIGIATESGLIKGSLIKSSVKEKHSKGGWSQKRFERLREEDIRHHTEKAGEFFKDLLEEYSGIADLVVIGGDKKTGYDIAAGCTLPVIYRHLETKPDRHCGEKLRKEIWSARWYRI